MNRAVEQARGASVPPIAPGVSEAGRRAARRVLAPVARFLHIEAASGVLLMAAAMLALAWANSPWSASYERLWHTEVSVGFGAAVARASLHFVINDVLMVIFFFVVGLEIKRELHDGELADWGRAVLPVVAAIGGMAAPALLFLGLNHATASRGWGVPMATDIAFAVGVLALLGRRVPSALRILLLAVAIIDDLGAILVIALFYSAPLNVRGILLALGALAVVLTMRRLGARHALLYVVPGVVLWAGVLRAGVHPTIAGVLLGLLTPARAWFGARGFVARTRSALSQIPADTDRGDELIEPLDAVGRARREAVAPTIRLQHALHPWVAYGIMPLFAFANAGVPIRASGWAPGDVPLAAGIILGLVIGKPLGVVGTCALALKLGVARLPSRVTLRGVIVVGVVAGIGFTMALFIAELAFVGNAQLKVAKLAVVVASAVAAVAALALGRLLLPMTDRADVAPEDAEQSAEH